ncbi:ribosomal RNA small subunit methyltransferase A [Patescibacteria group bacterium]|nr:ribosomal RNA small subunit methyltransferase A [Patescibacteria group bacterium]
MDLTDIGTVRRILQEYQTIAQKRLGQHFLVSSDVLDNIITAAKLTPKDKVLEIGPGFGTLTRALAQKAYRVVAVEKDTAMIKACRGINADLTNIQIIEGNALALSKQFFQQYFPKTNYKLVANLPYYLTSAIIRFFLNGSHRPDMMVLMVQKEVAERIVATPPDANLLSVAVQFYGAPEIVTIVPKQNFWPMPKVDSAVIRITPYKKPHANIEDNKFFRLVKAGFGERRKQIHNSLAGGLHLAPSIIEKVLAKSGIEPTRRAQTLNLKEWIKLYKNIEKL